MTPPWDPHRRTRGCLVGLLIGITLWALLAAAVVLAYREGWL